MDLLTGKYLTMLKKKYFNILFYFIFYFLKLTLSMLSSDSQRLGGNLKFTIDSFSVKFFEKNNILD